MTTTESKEAQLEALAARVRDAEPPAPAPGVRQRQIALAVAAGVEAHRPRRTFAWLAPAVATMAVVAAVLVGVVVWRNNLVRGLGVNAAAITVVAGELDVGGRRIVHGSSWTAGEPTTVQAAEGATVSFGDGSRVEIDRHSRLAVEHGAGWRWRLERGQLHCEVAPQKGGRRFVVDTPEAEVLVVGTRFRVMREERDGTLVTVDGGVVEVADKGNGRRTLVRAGESLRVGGGLVPPAPEPSPDSADGVEVERAHSPVSRGRLEAIRSQIRSGKIAAARRSIVRARRDAGEERGALAELSILEAEASLAERRYADAIASYLGVFKRYRGTPQAETALFAAAQLALDHSEGGVDGNTLLRRYVEVYPRGRYVEDARRQLANDGKLRR